MSISIISADKKHAELLSELAMQTFIESHGSSAPKEDIDSYVIEKYTAEIFKSELENPVNSYHLIYQDEIIAGYSNIIADKPYPDCELKNIAKLERLYILKRFYNQHVGSTLFDFNIELVKRKRQSGVWLYVWKGNERAIKFYNRYGFEITGNYDFPISKSHSNPNYRMKLRF